MQTVDQQPGRDRGKEGRRPGTHTHVHCHVCHVQNDTRFNGASQPQLQPDSSCSSTRCAPDTLIDATAAADAHANGTTVAGGRGEVGVGMCTVNCLAVSRGDKPETCSATQ